MSPNKKGMYKQGFVSKHICRRYDIMHFMKDTESRTLLYAFQSLSAGNQIAANKLTQIVQHISQDLILHRTGNAVTKRQDITKTFSSSLTAQQQQTL
uniref:Uncharacterized protein n=1 Tax=Cyanistes caeruleus TaxID=156563 RepID=A0A8C0V844_CYACU